jgi:zinc knuckle protein
MSQSLTPEGAELSGDDRRTDSQVDPQTEEYSGPHTRARDKGKGRAHQPKQLPPEAGPSRNPQKVPKKRNPPKKDAKDLRMDRLEDQLAAFRTEILAAINNRNVSEGAQTQYQDLRPTVEFTQPNLEPSPGFEHVHQTRFGSPAPRYMSANESVPPPGPALQDEPEDPNDPSESSDHTGTPEEDTSDTGRPRYSRKTQLTEKITPLSDGTDPTFLQWRASVRDRLTVNRDHYPDHYSQKALIWGVTTGDARSYLEPQYLSDAPGVRFETAPQMINLLGSYFLTGTETEKARDRFDDMVMGEKDIHTGKDHRGETFPQFRARFQVAALQGHVNRQDWFHLMWKKLTYPIRKASEMEKSRWGGNYNQMCNFLTAFDQTHRRNQEISYGQASTKKSPTAILLNQRLSPSQLYPRKPIQARSTPVNSRPRTGPLSGDNNRNYFQKKTDTTIRSPDKPQNSSPTDASKRNCYLCGKPGHWKNECPLNTTVKEMDGGDSEGEQEEWEETVENPDEEENDEA